MTTLRKLLVPVLACVLGAVTPMGWAKSSARAEALEIEDKDRATLNKETLKQKRMGHKKPGGPNGMGSEQGCGNVDIGNSDGDKKGSSRVAERNKTVIVTGNVYNTAKCR